MIQSMTGFGTGKSSGNENNIVAEIRSLNSKYTEISLRMPFNDMALENDIRNEVTRELQRGKISINLSHEGESSRNIISFQADLIEKYYNDLNAIRKKAGIKAQVKMADLLNLPGAWQNGEPLQDATVYDKVWEALRAAMDLLQENRKTEGHALQQDMLHRCGLIEQYLKSVFAFEQNRTELIRTRLLQQLADFADPESINHDRFEQEMVYYMEKLDITEEKIRLQTHIDYFRKTLDQDISAGKKLNFISQEMGREINTMGSKAGDASIQKLVVNMKDELEKIKEQTANIL